ncbi:NUDIX domain-containing protein [Croceicoccus sp. YJ47]|uniref:NUDIX domain-containing protein n=1 Tax=Croceicoccus sp. YJ47 TaxID=2798724 RepID=UPI001F24E9CD|nr:NUDIX hydrolase [Croceicoccus sp. YJ47]
MPLIGLLPAGVHRAVLRVAEQVRRRWWRLRKPTLRGVAIAAFDDGGRVLLVRHSYRMRDEWHLPTGGCRRGEEPMEAGVRELAEETGLRAGDVREIGTDCFNLHGATNNVTILAIRAQGEARADGREIREIRWADPRALPPSVPQWARGYIEQAAG